MPRLRRRLPARLFASPASSLPLCRTGGRLPHRQRDGVPARTTNVGDDASEQTANPRADRCAELQPDHRPQASLAVACATTLDDLAHRCADGGTYHGTDGNAGEDALPGPWLRSQHFEALDLLDGN